MGIYVLQEEDRIIKKEAALLKDKVGGRDVTKVMLVLNSIGGVTTCFVVSCSVKCVST